MSFFLVFFSGLVVFLFWVCGMFSWGCSLPLLGVLFSDFPFDLFLEDISITCLFMLLCCGGIALFYCFHYFSGSFDSFLLYPLMVWFLGVMCFLVLSGCFLFSLVFWEYLGLVSFFLILFYSNSSSLRASLITLFASRFGDVALFFLIMWSFRWFDFSWFFSSLFLFLVVFTKSAGYPFISWLLEAMRAPTPVSSLVHSSTLVAAGVWFFFRYSCVFGPEVMSVMFLFSITTILISGCCALFFNDLKKLVALSTCNNVSWCLLFFICGDLDLALLQLLTHGVCKCYLFMSVGDLMGLSGSSQSSVGVYLSRYVGIYGVYLQALLILSLCGIPFLGVFFSKHVLFSGVSYIYGLGYVLLFSAGFFVSYAYSFRFVLLLLKGLGGLSQGYSSWFLLISLLGVLGTIFNFLGVWGLSESVALSFFFSSVMLLIQLFGSLVGWWVFNVICVGFPVGWSMLLYSDSVVSGLYGIYLGLSGSSILSFYRWELYLVGLWPRFIRSFLSFRLSMFSFNVFVFWIFLFLFFSFAL